MTIITWPRDSGGLGVKTELNLVQSRNRGFTVRAVSAAFHLLFNDKQTLLRTRVKTHVFVFFTQNQHFLISCSRLSRLMDIFLAQLFVSCKNDSLPAGYRK